MVENAVASGCARHHGGSLVRQVNFDTQRGLEAFCRLAGRGQAAGRKGIAEVAVERELNRYVPIRRAADTRPLASVIRMDAQRVYSRGHLLRITKAGPKGPRYFARTIICSPRLVCECTGIWDLGVGILRCAVPY